VRILIAEDDVEASRDDGGNASNTEAAANVARVVVV